MRAARLGIALLVAAVATGWTAGCGGDSTPAIIDTSSSSGSMSASDTGTDGAGSNGGAVDGSTGDAEASVPPPIGRRPSRSGTVAIADDDAIVAMVNPDDDTVTFVRTADASVASRPTTGDEPSQVVFHPSGKTVFVANRAAGSVVRIDAVDTGAPVVSAPAIVGSEPTGMALTPSGNKLFVAEYGESRISVLDTSSMKVVGAIALPRNPRAVLVTNDRDTSDDDETLVVTDFFGEPATDGELRDDGRIGRIRLFRVSDNALRGVIALNPLSENAGDAGAATSSANQLAAIAMSGSRLYVPTISVSPATPLRFDQNVRPVLYVADVTSISEVRGPTGTQNLLSHARAQVPEPRFTLGDLVDIDFAPGTEVAYAVSRGADVVQRVEITAAGFVLGTPAVKQISLRGTAACVTATGIAVASSGARAYVSCLSSRKLAVLDLGAQSLLTTVDTAPPPSMADQPRVRGRQFFFTGRGRWSYGANAGRGGEGWSSCGSCHPDGLSDNVTWVFAAGPRQTTSLDGSYSHSAAAQKQRVFNWTANADEIHDFEGNTRGVSGGRGAIYNAPTVGDCADPTKETQTGLSPSLGAPTARELQAQNRCTNTDWDDIEAYVKAIRPPHKRRSLDAGSVSRGATLFATAGCAKCHGGEGWTVSTRVYAPSTTTNNLLAGGTVRFLRPMAWPVAYSDHDNVAQITAQAAVSENGFAIGPLQVACAIRNVGTFGYPGDAARTDTLELKSDGTRAQGRGGYNVPSLYGLGVTAPYLHHGLARSLEELLVDARFQRHRQSGLAGFAPNASDRADLIAFLLSIDEATTLATVPTGFGDGCRAN